jgi:hypothetical protein
MKTFYVKQTIFEDILKLSNCHVYSYSDFCILLWINETESSDKLLTIVNQTTEERISQYGIHIYDGDDVEERDLQNVTFFGCVSIDKSTITKLPDSLIVHGTVYVENDTKLEYYPNHLVVEHRRTR